MNSKSKTPTRTEKRYLVVREDRPDIIAFAIEDLMKMGVIIDKGDIVVVDQEKLMEDMPVYYRVLLSAFGMERKKDKKSIKELVKDLMDVEYKFFTTLRTYIKGYYDFKAEHIINIVSAASWVVAILGWIPFLLLKDTPIYSYVMWSWIFIAPLVAGLITLKKPPLTEEGRKLLAKETDSSIKMWKPESSFIALLARGLNRYRSNWLEVIAAKGTRKKEVKVIKWF